MTVPCPTCTNTLHVTSYRPVYFSDIEFRESVYTCDTCGKEYNADFVENYKRGYRAGLIAGKASKPKPLSHCFAEEAGMALVVAMWPLIIYQGLIHDLCQWRKL